MYKLRFTFPDGSQKMANDEYPTIAKICEYMSIIKFDQFDGVFSDGETIIEIIEE